MRSNAYISNCRVPPAQQFFFARGQRHYSWNARRFICAARVSPGVLHAYTHIFSSHCLFFPPARVGITQKFTYEKSLLVAHIINRGGWERARKNVDGEKIYETREKSATMKIIKTLLIVSPRSFVLSARFVGVSRFVTRSSFLQKKQSTRVTHLRCFSITWYLLRWYLCAISVIFYLFILPDMYATLHRYCINAAYYVHVPSMYSRLRKTHWNFLKTERKKLCVHVFPHL